MYPLLTELTARYNLSSYSKILFTRLPRSQLDSDTFFTAVVLTTDHHRRWESSSKRGTFISIRLCNKTRFSCYTFAEFSTFPLAAEERSPKRNSRLKRKNYIASLSIGPRNKTTIEHETGRKGERWNDVEQRKKKNTCGTFRCAKIQDEHSFLLLNDPNNNASKRNDEEKMKQKEIGRIAAKKLREFVVLFLVPERERERERNSADEGVVRRQ